MSRSRAWLPLLLALPGLALAVAGLFHPHHLDHDTAQRWYLLHLPGLLVFPLVGVALAVLVRGRTDPVACVVRLTAYVYATFYTALDVVSGIGAGYVTRQLGPDVPRPEAVSLMFRIGTPLGQVGSWALLGCCAVLALDQLRRQGLRATPGLLLVVGAWLVHSDHIFAPVGVAGMTLLGLATGWLALVGGERAGGPTHRTARGTKAT
jgi:hypothetical protein